MAEQEVQWFVTVEFTDSEGETRVISDEYYQVTKPDRTRVINDLVPRGSTTTGISIIKM